MQVIFKDFKKEKIPIELDPQDTILSAKVKLAEIKGIDAKQLKFVYSGKVLQDDKTIGSASIKPDDQIIFMVSKAVKKPASPAPAQAQVETSTTTEVATPSTNVGQPQEKATPAPAPAPVPPQASASSEDSADFDESTFATGSTRESAIQNIIGMGFDRPEVERALKAAFNNPDRAVEYLLNGLPAVSAPEPPVAATEGEESTSGDIEEQNQGEDHIVEEGEETSQDLFAQAASAGDSNPSDTGLGLQGAGLDRIRDVIKNNPEMLEPILEQLIQQYPQLSELIQQDPEGFVGMLMNELGGSGLEGGIDADSGDVFGEGEGDEGVSPGTTQIPITQQDQDAINRLIELGFERDLVIQIYFACDKNEEYAANILFNDHADQ